MEKYLLKAIAKFNSDKQHFIIYAKKYSAPYGKWNDAWNIDKVLSLAFKYYQIDKILKDL
jgi:hypothetical protein